MASDEPEALPREMTERLYYNDPYLLEFDAEIVDRFPVDARHGLVLDRTAFYPTSGGQPNDTGTIAGGSVVDCYEEDSGRVVHVLDEPVEGDRVHAIVDRERRIDHMQQHSGQHVLSQAFVELFGWGTVGFHLGAVASTIDVDVAAASADQIVAAEALANRTVLGDARVAVEYVENEDLAEAGLRKPTERTGRVRVIDIEGFDRSACGGTHVRATGQIGPILITRTERVRKQVRVEFLCGYRAVRHGRNANRVLNEIAQITSAPALQSVTAVQSMKDELLRRMKTIEELQTRLIEHEAASFPLEDGFAVAVCEDRTPDQLRELARKICVKQSAVVLFATRTDPASVVFAASEDRSVDVGALLKKVIAVFGGRGGGRRTLAQGGIPGLSDPSMLLEFARKAALTDAAAT